MKIEINLTADQRTALIKQLFNDLIEGELRPHSVPRVYKKRGKYSRKKQAKDSYAAPIDVSKISGATAIDLVKEYISNVRLNQTFKRKELKAFVDKQTGRKNWDAFTDKPLGQHVNDLRDIERVEKGVYRRVA